MTCSLMSCDVYLSFRCTGVHGNKCMCACMCVFVQERAYPLINTPLDSASCLQEVLGGRLGHTGRSLGELVGEMVLRLVHDHILLLRITSYAQTVLQFSAQLNKHSAELQVTYLCHCVYKMLVGSCQVTLRSPGTLHHIRTSKILQPPEWFGPV